jgi:hypothetical protein
LVAQPAINRIRTLEMNQDKRDLRFRDTTYRRDTLSMRFLPADLVRPFILGFAIGGIALAAVFGLSGGVGSVVAPSALAAQVH